MYILIEFTEEKCLAIIPDNWKLGRTTALWPNTPNVNKLQKMVRSKQDPDNEAWESYPMRVLYENESYDKVRSKLKRAEEESDLATASAVSDESGDETARRSKRKRKTPQHLSSSEDELESDHKYMTILPKPPTPISLKPATGQKLQQKQGSTSNPTASTSRTMPSKSPVTPVVHDQRSNVQMPQTPMRFQSRDISNARDVRLFTTLEQIKASQAKQHKIMEAILRKLDGISSGQTESSTNEMPDDIMFPLNTLEELNSFEAKLEDTNILKSVVNHLTVIGGKTPREMVRRILKNTIKSSIASQYNWYGKKGKMPFGKLRLTTVLQRAVRKVKPDSSELEVELATREWLRTATDRDGGRKRRQVVAVDKVQETVSDQRVQETENQENSDHESESDSSSGHDEQ